ncbi:urokinase plasminogen activator surface receptor-like [Anarhichas minor]|uniref:urokinase plasminogen activator surface receptor-like n=1 Tax=Anarhichas minor TaxID=65739 RepID=UPI003F735819
MHLLTLICGIVLLSKAHTLRCYECVPGASGTCQDRAIECPLSGQQCAALRLTSYAGGSILTEVNTKGCALAQECVEGSINFGISKTIITSECCNSALCNVQFAPVPSKSIANGKKCFQCNGKDCTATLNCEGTEDHCISARVTTGGESITVKGCASKVMCAPETAKMSRVSTEISCCQGNYCNSASSTSAGLLLLVAPLVSLFALS